MGTKRTVPSNNPANGVLPSGPHILINGVMTGTNTILSDVFIAQNLDNLGLKIKWTGTAVGTITVQGCVNGTDWDDLTFNPALAQPAGSASGYLINLNQVPYPYIRVSYTNASSTGVLNVWIAGKDLN